MNACSNKNNNNNFICTQLYPTLIYMIQKKLDKYIERVQARGGTWVFFGWVRAAETPNWRPVLKKKIILKLIPLSRNGPIFYTPF